MQKFLKGKKKIVGDKPGVALPWIEKYRPSTLEQMAHQHQAVSSLKGVLVSRQLPQLLFYGPAGTGKTSAILALSRELFGEQHRRERILELNASDQRGISVVRQKIKNFSKVMVSKVPGIPNVKLIILDEADSMTHDAQSALRRIMEDCSETTRFCIICNYISKIIDPIGSRCIKFRFKPIPLQEQRAKLLQICAAEGLAHDESAVARIVQLSGGDLRKSVNMLQLVANTFEGQVRLENVNQISGDISSDLVDSIINAVVSFKSSTQINQLALRLERQGIPADNLLMALMRKLFQHPKVAEEKRAGMLVLLCECERRLKEGGNVYLQLNALLCSLWAQLHL